MKIFYLSCHAILEYDEIKLFHELGYDVFSAGAYSNPAGHPSLPRPGLPELTHYPELERAASTIRATGGVIPQEIIDWADTIIFMHEPEILEKNWEKLKTKRVVFRSIGQCVGHQETLLAKMKLEGLQIVRYSPRESVIPNYAGTDAMIRFYKDPEEYKDWNGNDAVVINVTQSLKQRAQNCFYQEIMDSVKDIPHKIYGLSNEDLGEDWGGELTPEGLRDVLRNSRAYIYGGTSPASYTLAFIEAMMTGIPIVALGREFLNNRFIHFDYSEIPEIIEQRMTGYVCNNIEHVRACLESLVADHKLAYEISKRARAKAIELFGKEKIGQEWKEFLG